MLPYEMITVKSYISLSGKSIFDEWLSRLNAIAAAKVTTALTRVQLGHKKNLKSVGDGVYEIKIDFGPGYRVYFGWEKQTIILLLNGGSKNTQKKDIARAKELWIEYKSRQ